MLKSGLRAAARIALVTVAAGCAQDATAPIGLREATGLLSFAKGIIATVHHGGGSMRIGQTEQFTVTLTNPAGHEVPSSRPIEWSTSDDGVATVSETGIVTAVGPGTATITASGGGATGNAVVNVVRPTPHFDADVIVTVLDAKTRTPLAKWIVNIHFPDGTYNQAFTDHDGQAYFTGVLSGTPAVVVASAMDGSGRRAVDFVTFARGPNSLILWAP